MNSKLRRNQFFNFVTIPSHMSLGKSHQPKLGDNRTAYNFNIEHWQSLNYSSPAST